MTQTSESKSQLARLFAEENILVEHAKTATASFDLKTRTLTCPIWKEMSGALYDLIMGHEVGHALYTPAEGWHHSTSQETGTFRFFLNILEDARIEKKMKRKFRGLILPFTAGYQELRKRNFFGVEGIRLSTLPLIDRLNLYAKGGSLLDVPFTPEELPYVLRMDALETWDEVVAMAKDLYAYEEVHQSAAAAAATEAEGEEELLQSGPDGDEDGEDSSSSVDLEESESEQDESEQDSTPPVHVKFVPLVRTEAAYRLAEQTLLSDSCVNIQSVTLPIPNLDQIVTPYAMVSAELSKFYIAASGSSLYQAFLGRNREYIARLAQEFERTKSASMYKKTKWKETGDLAMSALYRYTLLDDVIFKSRMQVPQGKSHGMVLLLDRSGSMRRNIADAVEQILVLVMFCRSVQIPCVVYSFGDRDPRQELGSTPQWTYHEGDLIMGDVALREMISTELTTPEWTQAMTLQLLLAKSHEEGWSTPSSERLQNTPLNEALVAIEPIMRTFRTRYRLDRSHLVILQDGDTNGNSYQFTGQNRLRHSLQIYDPKTRIILRDAELSQSWVCDKQESDWRRMTTKVILEWLQARTGAEIFGWYLIEPKSLKHELQRLYRSNPASALGAFDFSMVKSQFMKERYLESYTGGYTRFCFIRPELIREETLGACLPNSMTAPTTARLRTAFAQSCKRKSVNRVLVRKWMALIA